MPANVSVPADFGRHYDEESYHNNLTFNLRNGNKIKANSMIMALNSSVIARMTKNNQLPSIDATDFSKEAVNCFIEASYTGSLREVNWGNVADVIEISRMFKVHWLVDKCEELFWTYRRDNKLLAARLEKARKVYVPADFGRHFIGVPTHENLTFNLGDGVKIKANSIILALNSPVIDNLTTNLHQTSLEADDFCKEAVECFIESTYTGDIETLNLDNFRDLNKMSRVFKVSWLVAKCEEYFVSYLENLNHESSYRDIMFAADEAVYLKSAMKNEGFLKLVLDKLQSFPTSNRRNFIKSYLPDLQESSVFTIDACIAMVKTDVDILAELLIAHLKRDGNTSLDVNSRHLLRNLDITWCFFKKREFYTELFDALESLTEVTNEDYKLFLLFHNRITSIQKSLTPVSLLDLKKPIAQKSTVDIVIEKLSDDKDITNLYTFIDGLRLSFPSLTKNAVLSDCHATVKISRLVKERGWSPVDRMYTTVRKQSNNVGIMFSKLNSCENIVTKKSGASLSTVFECSQPVFVRELFHRENLFMFCVPGNLYTGLTFVLLTPGLKKGSPFELKWCLFDRLSGQGSFRLPRLHFALVVNGKVVPITWCGQPNNFRLEKCWNWGYIRFHDKGCTVRYCGGDGLTYFHITSCDQVKLVAFVF